VKDGDGPREWGRRWEDKPAARTDHFQLRQAMISRDSDQVGGRFIPGAVRFSSSTLVDSNTGRWISLSGRGFRAAAGAAVCENRAAQRCSQRLWMSRGMLLLITAPCDLTPLFANQLPGAVSTAVGTTVSRIRMELIFRGC
jgi:hypothetical protein